ncbi:hypothetical protein Goarm_019040 [Gossypium armourianum]|uniref:RNase H type-1 domain-containing protein n=1 Tax=Gossypium armourianum TaxID=34283 RepID=A0A7J9IJF5_9ROSI|nr:hypothetical protein [Gossypium armourianum]
MELMAAQETLCLERIALTLATLFDWVNQPAEADYSNSVCWTRPEREWIKCNIDATMNKVQGASSFAVVIRDHTGAFIQAVSD